MTKEPMSWHEQVMLEGLWNEAEEGPLEFVYFWNENPRDDLRAYLNQWCASDFVFNNFKFANAEQAMMASKAHLFKDWGTLAKILQTTQPWAVKALGREVKGFVQEAWTEARFEIVRDINIAKFSQNEDMAAYLESTGDKILVEASPFDKVWGIGVDETGCGKDRVMVQSADLRDPITWPGLNLLGHALMETRAYLRQADFD